jgi:hypothetical protein
MTWTAPMTAVSGSVVSASDFNTFVRDNLNECPAAKAVSPGSLFVGNGSRSVIERTPSGSAINVAQGTASTTFVDLATAGPSVTVTTGSSALVVMTAEINVNTGSAAGAVGVAVSGATTLAADANYQLKQESASTAEFQRCSAARLYSGLTPGSNTFKMQYRVTAGTGAFNSRHLAVVPL